MDLEKERRKKSYSCYMASLNCREGSWPIDFLGTHYSVSILTTLIRVTLTRTSSILTEEMKMHRYPLLSINDSVISLSHIRTEIWNTHNSRSEFSFQISNKTWTRMKMMKKGLFFRVHLFKLCCNYRNPVDLCVSFPKNLYAYISVSSESCMYSC